MHTAPRVLLLSIALAALAPSLRAASADAPAAGAPAVRPGADAGKLAAEMGHGRPVVLHFWATWCGACEAEFGRLGALLKALPGRGVSVALVSIDDAATRARVPGELRRLGVSALPSVVLDAPDPAPVAAALGEPRWSGALPATFVFDAHGRKVASFLGATTAQRLGAAVRAASLPRRSGAAAKGRPPRGPGLGPSGGGPPPAPPKD